MYSLFRPFFVLAGLMNDPEATEWLRGKDARTPSCEHGEQFDVTLPSVERFGLEMASVKRHLFRLRP